MGLSGGQRDWQGGSSGANSCHQRILHTGGASPRDLARCLAQDELLIIMFPFN